MLAFMLPMQSDWFAKILPEQNQTKKFCEASTDFCLICGDVASVNLGNARLQGQSNRTATHSAVPAKKHCIASQKVTGTNTISIHPKHPKQSQRRHLWKNYNQRKCNSKKQSVAF